MDSPDLTVKNVTEVLADSESRQSALDPMKSFIVQAPAGSGKTGLLTQRYLKLLSTINKPEEIIAITFTRKAAGEMRERILAALNQAACSDSAPENSYDKQTWTLARAALRQDAKNNWNLLQHSGRLRVQTIDSLCTELARQLPLLSEFGAVPGIIEDASILYNEAAAETLNYLENNNSEYQWAATALENLLRHQDNRMDMVQQLIAAMLSKRDQWLRHVADLKKPQLRREQIEPVLKSIVEDALQELSHATPDFIKQQLPELLRFAALNVSSESNIKHCLELQSIPASSIENLEQWHAIAELLFTNDNNWRKPKGVNKKIGFLAVSEAQDKQQKELYKTQKSKLQVILEQLQDSEQFKNKLSFLRILPDYKYSDDEWRILESLFKVLLFSAAQLRSVFSSSGQVDFVEMLLAAKRAMGDSEQPTDLSLRLDYQLKHLLVDEFQDTSQNQFDLFSQLTSGWQRGDGRTLFLVGDPMQSIYRFREAEVGLFLQAWSSGVGDVELQPLNLTVNFRSQKGIIEWVNSSFPLIFPTHQDKTLGAVSYTKFEAFKPKLESDLSAVEIHCLYNRDDVAEADLLLQLIQQAKDSFVQGKIAVLCRNKSHLTKIVSLLNNKKIAYQAIELNVLNKQQVVLDLISLTKALLHFADRIAWLALLRTPFIGLTLNDILLLTYNNKSDTVLTCLRNDSLVSNLSEDGQLRLKRVMPLLEMTLLNNQRKNLRSWIEGLWLALGGPACCETDIKLADAEVYFQLLESLDAEKEMLDSKLLDKRCERLFALADTKASDQLQLMTIHKSKGLEFETVIIPGLGKISAGDKSQLLYWCERNSSAGLPELVFGPIKASWHDSNQTTEYLKYLEQQKIGFELGRLLYVAVTRAKYKLHLIGHVNLTSDGTLSTPPKSSLLAQLWPITKSDYLSNLKLDVESETDNTISHEDELTESSPQFKNSALKRLQGSWICPAPPKDINLLNVNSTATIDEINLEYDWASDTALHIGTVVHKILEQLANGNIAVINNLAEVKIIENSSRMMLKRLGVINQELELASKRVLTAIANTLNDTRGKWILSDKHQDARSEYKITAVIEHEVRHMVIDRTFVDENNIRWIIDYKTGSHQGSGLNEYLESEQQRYSPQLQLYAQAMKQLEHRDVKLALYFPMMQQWREWQ